MVTYTVQIYDFNPRTHEECDLLNFFFKSAVIYFNPRTHEECDLLQYVEHFKQLIISIHALTKSATAIFRVLFNSILDIGLKFNLSR